MRRRKYFGYVNGVFKAWVLCPTCHAKVYLTDEQSGRETPGELTCQCGAKVEIPSGQGPRTNKEKKP
jgi:hypothetical protein